MSKLNKNLSRSVLRESVRNMALLQLGVVLFLLTIARASYDEDNTLSTLYYAYGAYCGRGSLEAWNCKFCNDYHPNFDIESHGAGVVCIA